MLRVRVLGWLGVERDGQPVAMPHGRLLQMVGYLALHPGQHPRRLVAERLWPDCSPELAGQRLRTALWELQRALQGASPDRDAQLVDSQRGSVGLGPAAVVDLLQSRELLDIGTAEEAVRLLAPGLAQELDQGWADQARREVDAWREEALAAAMHQAAEVGTALSYARHRVELSPLSEGAHRDLIGLLAQCGDLGAAMAAYEQMRLVLESELGVGPSSQSRHLLARLSSPDTGLGAEAVTVARARRCVPVATTKLVGRAADLLDLTAAVQSGRLVSVVGPGGVGKSRLAYALAALEEDCGNPVAVAELATTARASSCDHVVAAALRVHAGPGRAIRDAIVDQLELAPGLLVLDNCEHVLSAVRELAAHVVRWSPATTVLATSREPLGLPGERTMRLLPLPVPQEDESEEAIRASPGVQLLANAARSSGIARGAPEVLKPRELARLARRLDGLPLALELAGARIPSLGVTGLTDRLVEGLDVLDAGRKGSAGRENSLLGTLEWSLTMLTPHERTLLGLLCVPPGPFPMSTVQAMVQAAGLTTDPVVGTARLVEASLVRAHQGQVWSYSLLETIRVFGATLLNDGTADLARRGLVHWAVRFTQGLRALENSDEARVHSEATCFLPLVRVALQEARDSGDVLAQRRIITGIEGWGTWREQPEVWAWVTDLAAREQDDGADADILRMAAVAAWRLGQIAEMRTLTQRCVAADPEGRDGTTAARAIMLLAFAEARWSAVPELAAPVCAMGGADRVVAMTLVATALARTGRPAEALAAAQIARDGADRLGTPTVRALALLAEARAVTAAEPASSHDRAAAALDQARLLADAVGATELVASVNKERGLQALQREDPASAVQPLSDACIYWLGTGNHGPLRKALQGLAESLALTQRAALGDHLLRLSRDGELTAPQLAALLAPP